MQRHYNTYLTFESVLHIEGLWPQKNGNLTLCCKVLSKQTSMCMCIKQKKSKKLVIWAWRTSSNFMHQVSMHFPSILAAMMLCSQFHFILKHIPPVLLREGKATSDIWNKILLVISFFMKYSNPLPRELREPSISNKRVSFSQKQHVHAHALHLSIPPRP